MSLSPPTGGRFRRSLWLLFLVLLGAATYACRQTGRFLDAEDPLQKGDALFVLAGSRMERALEAADLYQEGWAPVSVMTHQPPDSGITALTARGIALPPDEVVARDALIRYGIPAQAFILPPGIHDNTAQEARTLRTMATERGWRRVIVVSSKFHLRRAAYAMWRELRGSGITVVMRGSRYDPGDPPRWWQTRRDIRWVVSEVGKLSAYVLGLGA